jgi:hypothetical protein
MVFSDVASDVAGLRCRHEGQRILTHANEHEEGRYQPGFAVWGQPKIAMVGQIYGTAQFQAMANLR